MKNKNLILIAFLFFANMVLAQKKFSNCSAAFLNNKMIVANYDENTKAKISIKAKGDLSVCTANISPKETLPVDKIPFMVALKDNKTNTLTLYSNKIYLKYQMENILKACKKGDHVVLITTKNEYALPHNEILVE